MDLRIINTLILLIGSTYLCSYADMKIDRVENNSSNIVNIFSYTPTGRWIGGDINDPDAGGMLIEDPITEPHSSFIIRRNTKTSTPLLLKLGKITDPELSKLKESLQVQPRAAIATKKGIQSLGASEHFKSLVIASDGTVTTEN